MPSPQQIEKTGRGVSGRVRRIVLVVWSIGIAVIVGVLWYAVDFARQEAIHSSCSCPLGSLHLAMHNYHAAHGHFPSAYLVDKDGTPIHSWRVLVLPYLGEQQLYDAYSFDEPWNGPNNIRVAHKMPEFYHCPSEPESESMTNYVVIVGKDTAFPFDQSTSYEDFRDGCANTILVAEIADSNILWTEPRDLAADTMSLSVNHESLPSISSARRRGPLVNTAGPITSYSLSRNLAPETLRAFTTMASDDEISMVEFRDTGFESLGSSTVTDQILRDFSHWNKVRDLWLSRSKVTDAGIACLRAATRLSSLNLSGTEVTDAALEHLKGLPDLHSVNLRDTRVSPRGVLELIASSDCLRIVFPGGWVSTVENVHGFQLEMRAPAITGEQLKLFGIVRAPAYVDLDGTAMTDEGLANLNGFTDLRKLRISNTQVTNAGLKHLAGLASLQELDLAGLQGVTDKGVKHLDGLTGIEYLDLSGTAVADAGLTYLDNLAHLKRLELSRTHITGAGLQHLRTLTSIQSMNLSDTRVNDAGLAHLTRLTKLEWLNVERTRVTDEGVKKLQQALPDCTMRR